MSEKKYLTPSDLNLPMTKTEVSEAETLKDVRSQVEQAHIRRVLVKHDWNITRAAEELAVSRPTLHDLIKKHGLKREGN